MTFETVRKAVDTIKRSSLDELRDDFLQRCIDYARLRAQWTLLSKEARLEMDRHRTLTHNALISSRNALVRNMRAVSEDVAWSDDLSDDRRLIGDFACYVACHLALAGA